MSTRTYHDRDGTDWLVWQVLPGEQLDTRGRSGMLLPDEMARGWLTFESASEKRRMYPIPPGWMECSDDDLDALCRAAAPVPERDSAAV